MTCKTLVFLTLVWFPNNVWLSNICNKNGQIFIAKQCYLCDHFHPSAFLIMFNHASNCSFVLASLGPGYFK